MENIYLLDNPNKIEWIYKHLRKFCKKSGVGYKASELAQWLRTNIGTDGTKVILYKDTEVRGFAIFYIYLDMEVPKVFVMSFYSELREAKDSMIKYIVEWAKAQCVESLEMTTYHNPETFRKMFGQHEDLKSLSLDAYVFSVKLEE